MVIELTAKSNEADVQAFLQSLGAKGINTQVAETGWWLGTYDKTKLPYDQKEGVTLG
jgi:hypothetical protein